MSTTSMSPRAVRIRAHRVAAEALPADSHRNSPRKLTQHQLFARLVLKAMLKLDYRGLSAPLADAPELGRALGMERVPHDTCFQKAAARPLGRRPAALQLRYGTAPKRLSGVEATSGRVAFAPHRTA